jgi:O-antigen/teichoic acid export membrane protein
VQQSVSDLCLALYQYSLAVVSLLYCVSTALPVFLFCITWCEHSVTSVTTLQWGLFLSTVSVFSFVSVFSRGFRALAPTFLWSAIDIVCCVCFKLYCTLCEQ